MIIQAVLILDTVHRIHVRKIPMSVMHQTLVYATAFIYIVLYRCSNQAAAEVKMCGRFICD